MFEPEDRLTARDRAYRACDLDAVGALEQVPMGAGAKGREDRLVILVHGQNEDRDVRAGGYDPPGRLDTVETRHIEVHQDDIGLEGLSAHDRLLAGRGLTDDGHALDRREQRAQTVAERRMVAPAAPPPRPAQPCRLRHGSVCLRCRSPS